MAADGLGYLAAAPGRAGRLGALLGAFAVYLWLTGLQMHHAEAAYCHPAGDSPAP